MKFDIVALGDHLCDPHTNRFNQTAFERYQTIVNLAVRADSLGFDSFWVGEHHANKYIVSSPTLVLATIAARTTRLRLGTGVSLLPNMDPIRTAEEFATLDILSGGRAEIGLGSGITEHTFRLFGQNIEDAAGLAEENLELIQLLWNEHSVNWKGRYHSPIEDVCIEPRTYSGRALPILRATGGTVATAQDAGKQGHKLALMNVTLGFAALKHMAVAYREAYKAGGHDRSGMSLSCSGFVFVGIDGAKAKDYFAPYFANYQAFARDLLSRLHATKNIATLNSRRKAAPESGQEAYFVGDVSEVTDKILAANDKIGGIDKLMVLLDVGGLPENSIWRSLDLYAEKVIPAVNAALQPAALA
jgi:alkanesulfonate monooxygenase SsuD/methylene tetrahydromethanopterin reductase-like flavin-dependent oxidoreductase (luciferase family)